MTASARAARAAAFLCIFLPLTASAQQPAQPADPTTSGIDDTIEAGEAEAEEPRPTTSGSFAKPA